MNVVTRHRIMSIEDFLAWEARQEVKYEFDGNEPVAMVGGSLRHSAIQRNLAISIGGRLRGSGCSFYGSDTKLLSAMRSRYPDGQVICGAVDDEATFTTSPVVVFEVLSRSTQATDLVDKAREYQGIPSVRQYIVLAQERMSATVLTRVGETWATLTPGAQDTLAMPEIGIECTVAELYEGVKFPAEKDIAAE